MIYVKIEVVDEGNNYLAGTENNRRPVCRQAGVGGAVKFSYEYQTDTVLNYRYYICLTVLRQESNPGLLFSSIDIRVYDRGAKENTRVRARAT